MYELRCVDGRFFPGVELDAEKRTELEQEFLGTVCENLDNLRELLRVEVFDRPTWTVPESVAEFVGELEDLEEAEPICTKSVDFSEVSIFHSRHEYLAYQKLLRKIRRGGVAGETDIRSAFIAAGLVNEGVAKGYKAYFTTMEDLINILRLKEITANALSTYNRYLKAHLIAIDDIMLFPIKKNEAIALFNLINHLHEQCSLIITTNKSPKQWAESMDDEVLATALLDRILYRCEVVKLEGQSYRMENRKNIFTPE
jgi:hypothetical protein